MESLKSTLDDLQRRFANEDPKVRVAARHLMARIDASTDMLARLSLLEGAASLEDSSVKPGIWLRQGRRGMRAANQHFGGALHPDWMTGSTTGLAQAAETAVKRVFGGGSDARDPSIGGETPESVVNALLFGMSPTTGAPHKPAFFEVGLSFSPGELKDLRAGNYKPSQSSGGVVKKFSARAQDVVRGERRRTKDLKQVSPHRTEDGKSTGQYRPEVERAAPANPLFIALRTHSPRAKQIREVLKQIVRTSPKKADAEVFVAYLDFIKDAPARLPTGKKREVDPTGTILHLVKVTGKQKSFVSRALKRMKEYVVEKARTDGRLKKLVSEIQEFGRPGWGGRRANDCMAEWSTSEDAYLAGCGFEDFEASDEDIDRIGEVVRTVEVGPYKIDLAKYPEAAHGAYKHKGAQ